MPSNLRVSLVLLFAGLLPWVASLAAQQLFGSVPRVAEPLHEILEVAGSCVALGVSVLLLLRVRHDTGASYFLWVVAGLVVMGLLDGVHAVVKSGVPWSWMRHGATLLGGILFGLIWLPVPPWVLKRRNLLILGLGTLACGLAAVMASRPDMLPAPWVSGEQHSLLAGIANGIGGIGFVAAAVFFVRRYLLGFHGEDLAFASQALLFGAAGMLLGFSQLWHPNWWAWHFARLLAYGVVLVAAYEMVAALYRDIARNAAELEGRVKARTAELSSTALFPEENPFPVLRAAFDGTLLYANRSARSLLEAWRCSQGRPVPGFVREVMTAALTNGAKRGFEVCVGERTFLLVAVPISERDYVNFYGTDITERKRAEEEREQLLKKVDEGRRRFEAVVENSPVGICAWRGPELVYELANPAYHMFAQGKQFLGKTYVEAWPEVVEPYFSLIRRVMESGEPYSARGVGVRIRRSPDGPLEERFFDISFTALPANESGQPGVLNLAVETTDQVRAAVALAEREERLRLALDGGRMGMWEWDLRTNRSVWNPREFELLDVEPSSGQAGGELLFRHLHPDDVKAFEESLLKARKGGGYWEHEFRIVRADGKVRWLAGAGRVLKNANGEPERIVGVNYDVTERKEFQAELERLVADRTRKLQELVGELEHFSYTITHDMRAPLRAMQGFAEVIMDSCANCADQQNRVFLKRIQAGAERMDCLIRDALSYSLAVRQELPLEPVDAGTLLQDMLDTYPEFQVSQAAITVEGKFPLVMANQAGLTQCFSNLLGNAVKFVKPGERPSAKVWAEQRGEWVRVWVEDSGVGIPERMLPRLFQMFARGHAAREGTGIGLALVRKVTERMGGKVGVESQEGKGSRFWLELQGVRQ